jgi:hypothetical protein
MTTSDWVTIGSMVISSAACYGLVAYRIGAFTKGIKVEIKGIRIELKSLSRRVSRLEKQMRKVLKKITEHDYEIKHFRNHR